jgi:hypothetical protein
MPQPELYREYDREEGVRLFGPSSEARALEDGEWVLFPQVAICFSTLGRTAKGSNLPSAKTFHWAAPRPSRSAPDRYSGVPLEIRAKTKHELHLFLRAEGTEKYVYAGKLSPAYSYGSSGHGSFGEADLDLNRCLPTDLWQRLSGKAPGTDAKHLDEALTLLGQKTTTEQRLNIIQATLSHWLGPLPAEEAWLAGDLRRSRIPETLRSWLTLVGRREEIVSQNNLMVPVLPPKLGEPENDGKILIFVENQGVYLWATSPEGEDPPVWGRLNEAGQDWAEVSGSLSEFLIGSTLFEFILHAPYGGAASWISEDVVNQIEKVLPILPIRPWAWPGDPSRFYGARGAYMFACPNGECDGVRGYSIWVGSMSAEPVAFLKEVAKDAWESSTF